MPKPFALKLLNSNYYDRNRKVKIMNSKILTVINDNCPQNHPCPSVHICPVGALHQKGVEAPLVDHSACIKCGKCTNFCPRNALVLA
jgi:Fe-S-cluster-containing hydrogenase component 2